ncbi:trypsin-like serine protease [Klebsiella aerogenes]|nr:trypsin-like serine protease [Klebsiella aerogenes]ELY3087516.1 trypsin-like serine protease [Klebsiella aerogenes]
MLNIKSDLLAQKIVGVIGEDDRFMVENTHVFPYSSMVYVVESSGVSASGVVIGKNTILTCAHVAMNGINLGSRVYPGQNEDATPFGSFVITGVNVMGKFTTEPIPYPYDFAVLTVNPNGDGVSVGDVVQPVPIRVTNERLPLGAKVISLGYPHDKPYKTLWQGEGKVVESDLPWDLPNMTPVDADITAGDSGGPILYDGKLFALNSALVTVNYGATINDEIYEFISKYINT